MYMYIIFQQPNLLSIGHWDHPSETKILSWKEVVIHYNIIIHVLIYWKNQESVRINTLKVWIYACFLFTGNIFPGFLILLFVTSVVVCTSSLSAESGIRLSARIEPTDVPTAYWMKWPAIAKRQGHLLSVNGATSALAALMASLRDRKQKQLTINRMRAVGKRSAIYSDAI